LNNSEETLQTGIFFMIDDNNETPAGCSYSGNLEMTLADLLSRLWEKRISGVAVLILSLIIGSIYLRIATYTYTAELVLTPTEQNAAKISSNLAGLGSLVGLNLGNGENSGFAMYEEAANSYAVAAKLSQDPVIMHKIFEGAWNQERQRWQEPKSVSSSIIGTLKYLLGVPRYRWAPPGPKDLQEYIGRSVVIKDDKIKPIKIVSFDHKDPNFSVYFVNKINFEADNFLRRKSLDRSSEYIKYLQGRLNEVQIMDYRENLLDQLKYYEQMRMAANSNVAFVAEIFGGAEASQRPTRPKPSIVLAICVSIGFISWILYAFLSENVKNAILQARARKSESTDIRLNP